MPTDPSPIPLTTRIALVTHLAEDNHEQLGRLARNLEEITRRHVLLIEQLRIALATASR